MQTIIDSDIEKLSKKALNIFLEKARSLLKTKPYLMVALCGGRSVEGVFKEFASSTDEIWSKSHIFMIDERVVPKDSIDSNFKLIMDSFAKEMIKKGMIPEENIHPYIIDSHQPDFGATKYYDEMMNLGDKFDIILVSAGEDGHIAALFPNHDALSAPSGYIYLTNSPKPPARRITASPKMIEEASLVMLLFIGAAKKDAYYKFLDKEIPERSCPAKIVLKSENPVIFSDIV
jgi:6-phosphogluconolactonase